MSPTFCPQLQAPWPGTHIGPLDVYKRQAKRRILPFSFVALWARPEGGAGEMRVLEGPPQPPFRGWNGFDRASAQGLPHFQKARFTGAYPVRCV